jgi:hypothetical protein
MSVFSYLLVAIVLVTGCSHGGTRPGASETRELPTQYASATPASTVAPTPSSIHTADAGEDHAVSVDISLAPELEAVLSGGPDVSVDLIEVRQLETWQMRAELRLQLEIQRSRSVYLTELLDLAEQGEVEFLERFDIRNAAAGNTTGYQFRMFRLIRSRIENALGETKASIAQLEALLSKLPTTASYCPSE